MLFYKQLVLFQLVKASIQIPYVRRGEVSDKIEDTFDSMVMDIGEELEDGTSYGAYLNLPPHTIVYADNKEDSSKELDTEDLAQFEHLCSGKYTNWLYRTRRELRELRQLQNVGHNDYKMVYEGENEDENEDERVTQRALLVKDGRCSYEEKVQNAFLINDLYHAYYEKAYPKSGWMENPLGTNIIRYIILYNADEEEMSSYNNNTEFWKEASYSSSQHKKQMHMKFISVAPDVGKELNEMLKKRFHSLKPGLRSPYTIGRMIWIDTFRFNSTSTSTSTTENAQRTTWIFTFKTNWYSFYVFVFLSLLIGGIVESRVRFERDPSTGRRRLRILTREERRRARAHGMPHNDAAPQIHTLSKEQVFSLPEVIYTDGFYKRAIETKVDTSQITCNSMESNYEDKEQTSENSEKTVNPSEEINVCSLTKADLNVSSSSLDKCENDNNSTKQYRMQKAREESDDLELGISQKVSCHSLTCFICLDDYDEGEKIRMLPCGHLCHTECIIPWLTERADYCPMCKTQVCQ